MSDEVIVIGENRPCLKLPAEISRHGEQPAMKNAQAGRASEVMVLKIRAGRQKVSAAHAELVRGRMRPRRAGFWHQESLPVGQRQSTSKVESGRGLPQSMTPHEVREGQGWRQLLDCASPLALC